MPINFPSTLDDPAAGQHSQYPIQWTNPLALPVVIHYIYTQMYPSVVKCSLANQAAQACAQ